MTKSYNRDLREETYRSVAKTSNGFVFQSIIKGMPDYL